MLPKNGTTSADVLMLFGALLAVALVPLFLANVPPLNDYPNHLARMHVLVDIGHSRVLQHFYRIVMDWQPNLAMDLIVPALAQVFPLEIAGRIFIGLTLLVTAGGTLALHYAAHRRPSLVPLLVFFFLYHRMFLWGLLNFCFGIGVMLFAVAAWLVVRRKGLWGRLAVSVPAAVLVYASHLYAFGLYAAAVGSIELWYFWRDRKFAGLGASAVQFLFPLYLFLFHGRTHDASSEIKWSTITGKLEAPFDVIYQYHLAFDVLTLCALIAIIGWGIYRDKIETTAPLLAVIAVFCVLFLLMPDELFSGYGADRRLPIGIALVAVAAIDWQPTTRWWRQPLVWGLIILFTVRMALVADVWHRAARIYANDLAVVDSIPRGSKVLYYALHPEHESLQAVPYLEIGDYGVTRRNALMPSLFTSPPLGSEAIAFAPAVERVALGTPYHILLRDDLEDLADPRYVAKSGLFRPSIIDEFDYVLIANPQALPPASAIPAELKPVQRGGKLALFKVR